MVSYASIHAKSWWLTDVPMFDDPPTFTVTPSARGGLHDVHGRPGSLRAPQIAVILVVPSYGSGDQQGFFPYTIGGVPFKYWITTIGGYPLINKPWFINPGLTLPKIVGLGNCLVKSKVHNPYISAIARWHATDAGKQWVLHRAPSSSQVYWILGMIQMNFPKWMVHYQTQLIFSIENCISLNSNWKIVRRIVWPQRIGWFHFFFRLHCLKVLYVYIILYIPSGNQTWQWNILYKWKFWEHHQSKLSKCGVFQQTMLPEGRWFQYQAICESMWLH